MMEIAVSFRPATEVDAEGVADVILSSRRAFVAHAPMAHSESEVRQWVAGHLIPSGGVTVAVHLSGLAEQIVGVMAVSREGAVGWIDQLYLRPDHVGRGFGSRLLDLALRSLGPPVRLYTFQESVGARRFYERHGFRAVAFGDGSDNEEACPDVLYEWRGENRIP